MNAYTCGNRSSLELLIRGSGGSKLGSILADGYFRICASSYIDELTKIPCRMVGKEAPKKP